MKQTTNYTIKCSNTAASFTYMYEWSKIDRIFINKNTEALKTSNMSEKETDDIKFHQTNHLSSL